MIFSILLLKGCDQFPAGLLLSGQQVLLIALKPLPDPFNPDHGLFFQLLIEFLSTLVVLSVNLRFFLLCMSYNRRCSLFNFRQFVYYRVHKKPPFCIN